MPAVNISPRLSDPPWSDPFGNNEPLDNHLAGKVIGVAVAVVLAGILIFKGGHIFWQKKYLGRGGIENAGERTELFVQTHLVKSHFGKWTKRANYDRRCARRKQWRQRFRRQFTWKTTNADYSWVWWDPGGLKAAQHEADK